MFVDLREQFNGELADMLGRIIEYAPDGIITIDQNQTVVMYNRSAEAMFGYGIDEMLGHSLTKLLPEYIQEVHHHHVKAFDLSHDFIENGVNAGHCQVHTSSVSGNAYNSIEQIRVYGKKKDGVEFPCEITISKTKFKDQTYFTAIVRDVTVQVEHEQRLLTQEQELNQYRTERKAELYQQLCEIRGKGID